MGVAALMLSVISAAPAAAATATAPWTFVSSPDWFNTDIADLSGSTPGVPAAPGWAAGASGGVNGVTPQMRAVYEQIVGEMSVYRPEAFLSAGDLINGRWFTTETLDMFAPVTRSRADAIESASAIYYGWYRRLFGNFGIGPVLGAIGDHEVGDDPWEAGTDKTLHLATMKRAFVRRTVDVLGLAEPFPGVPARPPETEGYYGSFALRLRNVLIVSLDQFDGLLPGEAADPVNGAIMLRLRGVHLSWLASLLSAARTDASLDHVIVQGHIPVLDPVRMNETSGLVLTGRDSSSLWQLLRQHDRRRGGKVCCYLAGEVHGPTVVQDPAGDIVQIVHGNPPRILGRDPGGNYVVFTVRPGGIDAELRRFDLYSDGTSPFWQPGIFAGPLVTQGPTSTGGSRTEGRLTIDLSGPTAVVSGSGWMSPVPYKGLPIHFQFDASNAGGHWVNTGDFGDLFYEGRASGGPQTVTGKFGNGLRLDGIDDYVASGRGQLIDGETRAVAAWVRLTAGSVRTILSYGGRKTGVNGRFMFQLNNGVPQVDIAQGVLCIPSGAPAVNDGQWHHVAVVATNAHNNRCSDLQFYVDGVAYARPTSTAALRTLPWGDYRIGTNDRAQGAFYSGTIDDVAVWHAALTLGQVRALVNAANRAELRYDAQRMQTLFLLHARQSGTAVVEGLEWRYVTGLGGSAGAVTGSGSQFTIQLDAAGTGVASRAVTLPPDPPPTPAYSLRCSADSVVDGQDAPCQGTLQPERLWAYLWPATGVTRVTFSVDGVFANTDTQPPWELHGGNVTLFAPGTHEISAVATLASGASVSLSASFLVYHAPTNQAPVIDPPGDRTVAASQPLSVAITARDADGPAPLILSAAGVPAGATFTDLGNGNGVFNWTPPASAVSANPYAITVTARDGAGLSSSATLRVTVVGGAQGSVTGAVTTPTGTANLTAEGTSDWVHVGLASATSTNRKASVAPQVGPVAGVGQAPARFSSSKRLAYAWTDGAPTATATTQTGWYVSGVDRGFVATLPAETGLRTAVVYLGGYQAAGRLEASLNDGSAAPYTVTMSDLGAAFDRRVAISYRAATPGSVLTLRYTMTAGTGNVTFQAFALQGVTVNQAPVIDPPADRTVAAFEPLSVAITARDADGPAPLTLTATGVPAGATFTDFGNGNGVFSWTPPASAVSVNPYAITVTARDGAGLSSSAALRVTVVGAAQGSVTGAVTTPTGTVDLTAEGTADWIHAGLVNATSLNRRANVTPQIGSVTGLSKAPGRFSASQRLGYAWNNGTPTAAATTHAGLFVGGVGQGFRVALPADPGLRTAVVYLGGYLAEGRLEASLNDGSAAPYAVTVSNLGAAFDRRVVITYRAGTPGSALILRYTMTAGTGNVTFQAVTLQPPATNSPIMPAEARDFAMSQRGDAMTADQSPVPVLTVLQTGHHQ